MTVAQPNPLPFNQIIARIEAGIIKIPQFQRDFVWSRERSAKLLDSMIKGYPIGTFIFWNTAERLRVVRNLGGIDLPDTGAGQLADLVLDGQQRLTSLYAAVKGLTVVRDGNEDDFGQIIVDLEADPASSDPIVLPDARANVHPERCVRLVDLMELNLEVMRRFPDEMHGRLQEYRDRISGYQFSVVSVHDAPLDVATEIFTRLNVEGKSLSVFEIMVARTFEASRSFDLAEEYDKLNSNLDAVDYGTIPKSVVLMVVGAIQNRAIKGKDILALPRDGFIDTWPRAWHGIELAVDYLRTALRIPVSRLLPYPHLLVPLAYFFDQHPETPLDRKRQLLEDFFWRTALTSRYSRSVESRLEADLARIDRILEGVQPTYDQGVSITPAAIAEHGNFRTGRAWVKGILCLLASREPRSFGNSARVTIGNDWLKQANSKNYHHFFPRGWAKRSGFADDRRINHVANITIVDAFLNKRSIGSRPPSEYLARYAQNNPDLERDLESHLIDLHEDGVLNDDFERFFANRCRRISEALRKRIVPIPQDATHAFTPSDEDDAGEE